MALRDSDGAIYDEVDIKEFTESIRFHGVAEETSENLSESFVAMTAEPREGLVIDLPIIRGENGPGVNFKGTVNDFTSLPDTGNILGDTWQNNNGEAVIWTDSGWSEPFRWAGVKGDRGPAGPRGDTAVPPRYRATLNGRNELSSVSNPQDGDFVVLTSGKGIQYFNGSWGAEFQWVGPTGSTVKGDKGDRGPQGDNARIADAVDFTGKGSGYVVKDGNTFRLEDPYSYASNYSDVKMDSNTFTSSNTRNTSGATTTTREIATLTAPFTGYVNIMPCTIPFTGQKAAGLNVEVYAVANGTTGAGVACWGAPARASSWHAFLALGNLADEHRNPLKVTAGQKYSIWVKVVTYGGTRSSPMYTNNGNARIPILFTRGRG